MIDKLLESKPQTVAFSKPILCTGKNHLEALLDNNGYGLLLRRKSSYLYDDNSLKIYSAHKELQALIIELLPPKSVKCKLPNGEIFAVQFNEPTKANVGSIVSFRKEDLNAPLTHYKLRDDLNWSVLVEHTNAPYTITTGEFNSGKVFASPILTLS
jgi:hypothetical protein